MPCDWEAIAAVKRAVDIPVVSNGGVESPEDLDECLKATGADGVMSSEAALENVAVFEGRGTSRVVQRQLTAEYIELARAHPPRCASVVKAHLFKLLYMALEVHREHRTRLGDAVDTATILNLATEVCALEEAAEAAEPLKMRARCDHEHGPYLTWYRRHRVPPA